MDTEILYLFKDVGDKYLSGEDICKKFNISRSAVWKHIEKLRKTGYNISAVPHLGYKLVGLPDNLLADDIKYKLKTKIIGKNIVSFLHVESTNDTAYSMAEKNAKEGTVVIAQKQSKGKGRLGRKWLSDKGGIYLSCILRPDKRPDQVQEFTLFTALSVVDAIKQTTGVQADIKWPNDIFIDGKKVCGVLTEMKAQPDKIDFIVVGIGINVNNDVHLDTSVSLKGKTGKKICAIDLTRNLLCNIEREYEIFTKKGFKDIREKIKKVSYTIGKHVQVDMYGKTYKGKAVDIDPQGALVIKMKNGKRQKVISGDVHLS
ncbi:MAG: biotin--[acetyl-CoA-carboxylase] ligase [Candidatus Omnitrophica bacterium]|nr:biotin--[acetyl-CoA-carboxylase] ligase [Candidatus Omnitrophota bacterium]